MSWPSPSSSGSSCSRSSCVGWVSASSSSAVSGDGGLISEPDCRRSFASRRGAVLAQLAIGERENELTQAVPLLREVDLREVLVTGDAMFAQRSLCAHIIEHGGHYLLEVKDNQPALLLAIRHCFRAR